MKPSMRRANDLLSVAAVVAAVVFAIQACQATRPLPPPAPVPAPVGPVTPNPVPGPTPAPAPIPSPAPVPPQDTVKIGDNEYPTGYARDPEGTNKVLQEMDKPTIREAGPELFEPKPIKDSKGVFLYRPLARQYAKTYGRAWVVIKQEIGDCVSMGWMHGCAIVLAEDVELGRSSAFTMIDTSGIYGLSRVEASGSPGDGARPYGGFGDGSYGAAAGKGVTGWGVLFRQKYDAFDLTDYKGSRSKEWGAYGCGGKGDGGKADTIAKEHPIKQIALVRNFLEAQKAIESGYPVPVCSGQGFASQRDTDGFAAARGSWSHCMCFVGVRYDPPGLLCLNSWGPSWISGPKWPDDQPDGSFWVAEKTATSMLRGGDSFAVASIKGFPFRDLDNTDWVDVRPSRPRNPIAEGPAYALSP